MTAEIAILNKSAIALAADSAVTISAGSKEEKIYDSADKLFELSCHDPIAVMINGGMNFMQVPLAVIVKRYRENCPRFERVTEAADDFLQHLAIFGARSSKSVKEQEVYAAVYSVLEHVKSRAEDGFVGRFFGADGNVRPEYQGPNGWQQAREDLLGEQIAVMSYFLQRQSDAEFVGEGPFQLSEEDRAAVSEIVQTVFDQAAEEQRAAARALAEIALVKVHPFQGSTGLVVAGFGTEDLFPTLAAFEIHGFISGHVKFSRSHMVDIDRDGERARVIPFAQREMVERFLYGLDDDIQRKITQFCKLALPSIRGHVLDQLDMSQEDAGALEESVKIAEEAFLEGLATDSFDAIRQESRSEIEDMVEFMPKPEMARMAEALVNLTSIKRRVSRGMETVGGPIDVAIISQAEGFVWVKRKHYFPQELNSRYFDRMRAKKGGEG